MSRSRLGLEAERLGSRLGLGHEGLVSIPGCRPLEEPGKKKPSKHFDAQFRVSVDIQDIVTCTTSYDDRLRGLGV